MKLKIFGLMLFVAQHLVVFSQSNETWSSFDFDNEKSFEGIKINNLADYTFFLSGETHTVSSSPKVKIELLKYLYKKANVRNFVIEDGYAAAYLFNLYLKTGDEGYICKTNEYYLHEEYREFCREFYNFNKQQKKKIKVLGVDDITEKIATWYEAMEQLFKDKSIDLYPEMGTIIKEVVGSSKKLNDPVDIPNYDSILNLKFALINNYKQHTGEYKKLLANDYVYFKLIIENNKSNKRTKHTNKNMFDNLQAIINANQVNRGNYFGQFGQAHVIDRKGSLTRFLNTTKNSVFTDKVLSIMPYYENCYASFVSFKDSSYVPITNVFKVTRNDPRKPKNLTTTSIYTLMEQKNKKGKPLKYVLYIKDKKEMKIIYPKCD